MDSDKVTWVSPRLRQQRADMPSSSLSSAAVTLGSKGHDGDIDPMEGLDVLIAEWTCTDLLPTGARIKLSLH